MAQRLALILGGSGALGRSLVEAYSSAVPALSTICIDYRPNPQASFNIPMSKSTPPSELVSQVSEILKGQKLAAVVNAAGGWTGGSLGDPEFLGQVDAMLSSSVGSAALASHLAALHLQEYALFISHLCMRTGDRLYIQPMPCVSAPRRVYQTKWDSRE